MNLLTFDAIASEWAKSLGIDRKQFNMFFDKMMDAFAYHKIVVDKSGKPIDYVFLEVNHAFEKMTELKRENIIGKKITSVLSGIEKDPADWIGIYGKVALTGEPVQFENYNEALCKWFKVVAYSPQKGYFVALFEDISERRKAEEELRAGEERYRHLVQYAPTAIYEIDFVNQRFKSVNDTMCVMSGYNRDELLSMKPLDNLAPESQIRFKQWIGKALAGEKIDENVEYKVIAKGGREFWVTLNMKLLRREGRFYGAQVVAHDITERKNVEEALKQSEHRFHQFFNSITGMFEGVNFSYFIMEIVHDKSGKPIDGIYREVNPATERLTGKSREQLIGRSRKELFGNINDSFPEKFDAVVKTGYPSHFENYGAALQRYYDVYAWKTAENQVGVILTDITERKRADAKIKEILSSITDSFIGLDRNWNIIYINDADSNIQGAKAAGFDKPQDLIGKNWKVLFQNEMPHLDDLHAAMEKGEVRTLETYGNFSKRYVEIKVYPSAEGITILSRDITERKKVDDALRKQSSLVDLSPDAIIVKKLDDTITFWSQGAQSLYGWTKEEALGRKSRSLLRTKFPEPYDVIVRALLSSGRWSGEKIHQDKFGHEIIVDSRWLATCGKQYEIEEILETNVDITERKKAQEALKQNAELARQRAEELEKLMDIIPAAVWVSRDPQCENIKGNQAANKFYEASGGENVSAGPAEGSAQDSTRRFFRDHRELMPQELPMQEAAAKNVEIRNSEIDVLLPSNRKITILGNAKPLLDNKGEVRGCLAVFMDVTERKQAEDALKEREQLYRTVFDNSQDGFQLIELVYDANGKPIDHKFLRVNHAYEKIIGVKAEDILDKTAKYISPNQEFNWLEVPDRVAKTRISEHVELYNKDINKTLDCYYFPYSKNVVGTLFRDVSERKKMEKQLQDQERLAAIGATAGMVGHDIRNPLQAITGDVFLAKTDLASTLDSEEKKNALESLDEIEKNVVYINKIVADLQDFARPLKPNAEETDLLLIIDDLLSKNGLPENVKVSIKVETEKVVADSTFISRIMYNLVNNDVQAMPKGGKLTIRTYKEANDTVISVKDTGVGISETVKGKLFTPMFTTKSKGQGFGLVVIKRMTESLGGTVSFESQEGKGTTFIVRLPLKELTGK